jgi:hypothetical protein
MSVSMWEPPRASWAHLWSVLTHTRTHILYVYSWVDYSDTPPSPFHPQETEDCWGNSPAKKLSLLLKRLRNSGQWIELTAATISGRDNPRVTGFGALPPWWMIGTSGPLAPAEVTVHHSTERLSSLFCGFQSTESLSEAWLKRGGSPYLCVVSSCWYFVYP